MPSSKDPPETPDRAAQSRRAARRARRRDRSREEILEAARKVLLRDGVAATTLDAVAREVGVTKPALYYYFPSKNALFFELIFSTVERHARAVHDGVAQAHDGGDALASIIRESMKVFAPRMDDFRLAFLYGQVTGAGSLHFDPEQFARIRPLNDLWFAGAAEKLARERGTSSNGEQVEPRLMAFLAYLSVLGLLTMKGMVESLDDPLIYSDEQLVEGMSRVFKAAAAAMEADQGKAGEDG